MINILELLKNNKYVQMALALLVGALLGAYINSGSSQETIKESMKQQYELKISEINKQHSEEVSSLQQSLTVEQTKSKTLIASSSQKIKKLTSENSDLKSSSKKRKYKLVKPDGTIVETEYDENNSEASKQVTAQIQEEFNQKLKSVENTWKKVHEEKVAELKKKFDSDLEKARSETKSKETNKEVIITKDKPLNHVTLQYDTNKLIDASVTRDVLGPLFIGIGSTIDPISRDTKPYANVGVGLSF